MAGTLKVENLYVRYSTQQGQVKALNGVNLSQEEGEVFCLVGESGAGKSTLALAIMGLLPPSATIEGGSIFYDGVDLLQASPEYLRHLRGKEISLIFQDAQSALNPTQLVGEQLEEVIRLHTDLTPRMANNMAQEILGEMGLPDPRRIMGQYPFSFERGYVPEGHVGYRTGHGSPGFNRRRAYLGPGCDHAGGDSRSAPAFMP